MKSNFNLQKLCEDLTKRLEKDSNRQNIIKLSIDISIPKEFYGYPEVCEKLLKQGCEFFSDKIINGFIKIDVDKFNENTKETTLIIKISGDDNIQNPKTTQKIDETYPEEFLRFKNKFDGIDGLLISRAESTLFFQYVLENVDSTITKDVSHTLAGKQILIAEDNEINAMVFSSFLDEWGCISSFAINGLEALQMAQMYDYDLILMDIYMPVLNGIQATEKIREFNKSIPIVALTASDLEQDYNGAQIAGISDYLIKPISSQLLRCVISRCILFTDFNK